VGIVRVEAELARFSLRTRPDVDFVYFDNRTSCYRLVRRDIVQALVDGEVVVNMAGIPDPRAIVRDYLSSTLHRTDRWLLPIRRPRRFLIGALESLRLRMPAGALEQTIGRVQTLFFNKRYRALFFDAQHRRRSFVPLEGIFNGDAILDSNATVFMPGADWNTKDPAALAELKRRHGFLIVMVCHDLIPIKFPHFYTSRDVEVFTNYYRSSLHFVDRFICVSRRTARDLHDFARSEGQSMTDFRVERLGANASRPPSGVKELAPSLKPRHYALFVSTIEPRKNHALLYRIWLQLVSRGIPASTGFKLVFVGRPGWNTEALMSEIAADKRLAGTIVHLGDVDDVALSELYRHASFCVYPSLYEGYGLPIVEALSYGRAVIASSAGSMPEVIQDFGPCLDPTDDEAWLAQLEEWITDPKAVGIWEAKIAARFQHPTWEEASRKYLQHASDRLRVLPSDQSP